MSITDYKQTLTKPLRPRTVTFLLRDDQVLLGYKKKGFGQGYFLGIGGKVEADETIEEAAKREVQEEINVGLSELNQVGVLSFYFPHVADESWNQEVHVFVVDTWQGQPEESEEIKPEWFARSAVPYDKMWDDAHYWLPQILEGQKLRGEFLFGEGLKVTEQFTQPF